LVAFQVVGASTAEIGIVTAAEPGDAPGDGADGGQGQGIEERDGEGPVGAAGEMAGPGEVAEVEAGETGGDFAGPRGGRRVAGGYGHCAIEVGSGLVEQGDGAIGCGEVNLPGNMDRAILPMPSVAGDPGDKRNEHQQ